MPPQSWTAIVPVFVCYLISLFSLLVVRLHCHERSPLRLISPPETRPQTRYHHQNSTKSQRPPRAPAWGNTKDGRASLQTDLAHEIERHYALHELIEDALTGQAQTQREHRDDAHVTLTFQITRLGQRIQVWEYGADLLNKLDDLSALTDPSKPHFRDTFTQYAKEVSSLSRKATAFMTDPEIGDMIRNLRKGVNKFYLVLEGVDLPDTTPLDS